MEDGEESAEGLEMELIQKHKVAASRVEFVFVIKLT